MEKYNPDSQEAAVFPETISDGSHQVKNKVTQYIKHIHP